MAYRRPLSKTQSIVIGSLWLAFFILFCLKGQKDLFSWLAVLSSGFIVFYPIVKSLRERKNKNNTLNK